MHRNVYFRDDTGPVVPFSAFDSYYPEDLWTYQEIQRNAGHENLAIPHNGNVSDGWMFSPNDEFANFELFENMINVGQPSQITYSYYRQGMVEGMVLEEKLGSNPFKYGLVGGADSHSAYSNNEEFAFHGSHGATDDTPQKRRSTLKNLMCSVPVNPLTRRT
jgi:hypothetical protein